jgi:hypothetical protein
MDETVNNCCEDMLRDSWRYYVTDYQGKDCPAEQKQPVFPAHALAGCGSFI